MPQGLASADWRIWAAGGASLLVVVAAFVLLRRRGRSPREREFEAYVQAVQALSSDDLDAAILALTAAAELNSACTSTYLALGKLLRRKGEVDRALRIHYNLSIRPDLPIDVRLDSQLERAIDELAAGRPKEALATVAGVLAAKRKDSRALEVAAEAHLRLSQWEEAYEAFRRLDRATGQPRPVLLAHLLAARGRQLASEGNLPAAKKILQKALGVDAQSVDALIALGDAYLVEKKARRAIETWEQIFEIDLRWVEILVPRLEQAFFALGEVDRMEGLLRRQVSRRPGDARLHLVLARHQEKKRRIEDALGGLKEALDLDPRNLSLRRERGRLALERAEGLDLANEFKALLGALPEDPPPLRCSACGAAYAEPTWRCETCRAWGTVRFN